MLYNVSTPRRGFKAMLALAGCAGATLSASGAIIYVKADAPGNNGGTSWPNAHRDLQAAFNRSHPGDEIWVAAGTYKPGSGNPTRNSSFDAGFAGVPIYGGFNGTETARAQRNFLQNPTVLSGEIGDPNTTADNAYHVVVHNSLFGPPTLDGFFIRGGNADGAGQDAIGGGLRIDRATGTYRNLVIENNRATRGAGIAYAATTPSTILFLDIRNNAAQEAGGAVYASAAGALTLGGVNFVGNAATHYGGAVATESANLRIQDCRFTRNSTAGYGGAIDVGTPQLQITPGLTLERCLFEGNAAFAGGALRGWGGAQIAASNVALIGNRATAEGGAVAVDDGRITLRNATFVANTAAQLVGGMWLSRDATADVANSIFWLNRDQLGAAQFVSQIDWENGAPTPVVQFSNIAQGPQVFGASNFAADPLFSALPSPGPDGVWGTGDDNYGNVRLSRNSPLTDVGSVQLLVSGSNSYDLQNVPRRFDNPLVPNGASAGTPPVDLGAYEYHPVGTCFDVQSGACVQQLAPLCVQAGDLFYGEGGGCPTGLFVDRNAPPPGSGQLASPFPTVQQALGAAPAGAVISVLRGGNYNTTGSITQPVRIVNGGTTGDVRIGAP